MHILFGVRNTWIIGVYWNWKYRWIIIPLELYSDQRNIYEWAIPIPYRNISTQYFYRLYILRLSVVSFWIQRSYQLPVTSYQLSVLQFTSLEVINWTLMIALKGLCSYSQFSFHVIWDFNRNPHTTFRMQFCSRNSMYYTVKYLYDEHWLSPSLNVA